MIKYGVKENLKFTAKLKRIFSVVSSLFIKWNVCKNGTCSTFNFLLDNMEDVSNTINEFIVL